VNCMTTESQFIDRLRRSDPSAFESLFEQFERSVYRFFFCSHRDHHLAQEQASETFLQLVRSLRRFRGGPEQLRPFVFAIARHVQKRPWREHVPLSPGHEQPAAGPPTESLFMIREELDGVLDVIQRLDDPVRAVLLLRFVEGLSLSDVAEALDLPLGTVKSHVHRGRRELSQLLQKGNVNP
jgi:RNA polymerase sigma-70 factor, ECF subfamily